MFLCKRMYLVGQGLGLCFCVYVCIWRDKGWGCVFVYTCELEGHGLGLCFCVYVCIWWDKGWGCVFVYD